MKSALEPQFVDQKPKSQKEEGDSLKRFPGNKSQFTIHSQAMEATNCANSAPMVLVHSGNNNASHKLLPFSSFLE